MEDLSLHILDIAENSISGSAKKIEIRIDEDRVWIKYDYFDKQYLLKPLFRGMNQKLEKMNIDPRIPWLGNRKLCIQFANNM